mgnify:CR=1 FL=1
MSFEIGKLLKVPRGTPGIPPLELELSEIIAIEKRKPEVAYVNKETAPELMYIFNSAYCEITRMMANISYEYNQSVKFANKRKAVVTLDVAPEVLKEKGYQKTSEDLRKAVLDQDEEYLTLLDKVYALEAAYEFLKGKAKGFEQDYQSVKKIYDITNASLGNANVLNGGINSKLKAGDSEPHSLIGEPKF